MSLFSRSTIKRLLRIRWFPLIVRDWHAFKRRDKAPRFRMSLVDMYPCVRERTGATIFDRHYVYHVAWAARKLAAARPAEHVDVSSSLYFAVTVSAFVPIRFFDYRPADLALSNLESRPADLLSLPFPDNSVKSLSCMHVVEHIGLGRYGEPIDPSGDIKACRELARVLAPGGRLLFVAPIGGVARIEFNAHRIYDVAGVRSLFPGLEIREFALISLEAEKGGLILDPTPEQVAEEQYGCGCFELIKPA